MAAKTNAKMITAVFQDRFDAQRALDDLYAHGYGSKDISVMMSDSTRAAFDKEGEPVHANTGNLAVEGMGVGGAIGTAVGAGIAAILAIGTTIAIPGVGLLVAGPIAAALAGGGAGAVTGGALGGLIGAGLSEDNATVYTNALKNGGVVLGVTPRNNDEHSRIKSRFSELNGENIGECNC